MSVSYLNQEQAPRRGIAPTQEAQAPVYHPQHISPPEPQPVVESSTRASSRLSATIRTISESIACLIVAVAILRMFLIEGYIISTGSMAPNLFGFHKQAQCPACQHRFAFGIEFDVDGPHRSQTTSCPNCDQPGITLEDVPRNDGDQLLVFKNAYAFRDPRRWEIVVFMNPSDPTQAYVKRVVGLPTNRIQIIDGDVFIDGHREQKPLEIQRAMRIGVFDQSQPVRSKSWIPRWVPEGKWKLDGQAFVLGQLRDSLAIEVGQDSGNTDDPTSKDLGIVGFKSTLSTAGQLSWINYMHWPRLPLRDREAVVGGKASLEPRPIKDRYGYNPKEAQREQIEVNDLMIDARISLPLLSQFVTVLRSRGELIVCVVNRAKGVVEAWVCPDTVADFRKTLARDVEPFAMGILPLAGLDKELRLEVSAFDRQLIVAINKKSLIEKSFDDDIHATASSKHSPTAPHALEDSQKATIGGQIETVGHSNSTGPPLRDGRNTRRRNGPDLEPAPSAAPRRASLSPVRLGAIGSGVRINSVCIYRDVHYTSRESQHAIESPVELGPDEFFFLGDNSPVSLDSRGWRNPVVPRRLIVGKPMVVHLPSRPARLQIGNWVRHVRVPEFSRMRVIR